MKFEKKHCCELCGNKQDLTLHHVIPQWVSKLYVEHVLLKPALFVQTTQTAILCRTCHDKIELFNLNIDVFNSIKNSQLSVRPDVLTKKKYKQLKDKHYKFINVLSIQFSDYVNRIGELTLPVFCEFYITMYNFIVDNKVTFISRKSRHTTIAI